MIRQVNPNSQRINTKIDSLSSGFSFHAADTTVHFTTESISGTYSGINHIHTQYALSSSLASHTGDSNIHFTKESMSSTIYSCSAGENLINGDLCFLKSDGKFYKAHSGTLASSTGMLAIATEIINADSIGDFNIGGQYKTTGLLVSNSYYVSSSSSGAINPVQPIESGTVVRIIGYAMSDTIFYFDPDKTFIVLE